MLFFVGFDVDLPGAMDALAHLVIVDLDVDAVAFRAFFQAFFLGCQMFFIIAVHAKQSPGHDSTSFVAECMRKFSTGSINAHADNWKCVIEELLFTRNAY